MNADTQTGLYGKLPAYGDFIFRNLNSSFINPWDEWLQHFISGSQEQIGENWLDIYLTSPIWRFVLSSGVIDNHIWAGLMMPSVDRVGRYFPISVVKSFDIGVCPVSFMAKQQAWFNEIESYCLSALDGGIDADQLVDHVTQSTIQTTEQYLPSHNLGQMGPMVFGLSADNNPDFSQAMPYVLNAALSSSLSSFSIWQTAGSDRISPMIFTSQGLPPIGGIASMLDGQWQQRDWKIPYNIKIV